MNGEVVAAGAAQTGRMPGIKNLAVGETHKAGSCLRDAARIHVRSAIVDNVAAHPDPFAMLTTASERKSATHLIPATHWLCLTRGRRCGRGCHPNVRIHLVSDVCIEEGGDISAVASDHRTPASRPLGDS